VLLYPIAGGVLGPLSVSSWGRTSRGQGGCRIPVADTPFDKGVAQLSRASWLLPEIYQRICHDS